MWAKREWVGKTDPRTAFRAFLSSLPALFVPVIILGGILSGATTVTEASAFGAAYALAIGAFDDPTAAAPVTAFKRSFGT